MVRVRCARCLALLPLPAKTDMTSHKEFQVSLRELTDEGEFCQDNLDPWLKEYGGFSDAEIESMSHIHITFIYKPDA